MSSNLITLDAKKADLHDKIQDCLDKIRYFTELKDMDSQHRPFNLSTSECILVINDERKLLAYLVIANMQFESLQSRHLQVVLKV